MLCLNFCLFHFLTCISNFTPSFFCPCNQDQRRHLRGPHPHPPLGLLKILCINVHHHTEFNIEYKAVFKLFEFFVLCRYELPVTATADNCLFSCYPFLAAHQSDFHIVCKQKGISIIDKQLETEDFPPGEAVFMPCVTPNRAPTVASTSATSTSFGISTSTYPESSNEATSSTYPSTPHHGDSQQGGPGRLVSGGSDGNGTFVMVPGMESDERKFIRKAVTAMQR